MAYTLNFNHGDRVIVLDGRGNHEARGVVAGRHETRRGPRYDVQPVGKPSLSDRIVGVSEERLGPMCRPVLVKGAV